jgi:exodeoxyribonuclease VII large subunit
VACRARWPCPQIVDALRALDRDPDVDVIVLARGGGSVEDLLPFSDETLCRAVADCRTPVVSAIGHEPDTPLVDHVADVRCSTPTEAGRRLVPDLAEETARIDGLRDRAARALAGWVDREERLVSGLRARPVLTDPLRGLEHRDTEVVRLRDAAGACAVRGLDRRATELEHLTARLAALGPAATLARGYAIVQRVDGDARPVLRSVTEVAPGDALRIRVGDGAVGATAAGAGPRRRHPDGRGRERRRGRAMAETPVGTGADVQALGYEQARDELVEVVRALEAGGLSLDDSVALWERGEALARRCEEQLAGARERVQRTLDARG